MYEGYISNRLPTSNIADHSEFNDNVYYWLGLTYAAVLSNVLTSAAVLSKVLPSAAVICKHFPWILLNFLFQIKSTTSNGFSHFYKSNVIFSLAVPCNLHLLSCSFKMVHALRCTVTSCVEYPWIIISLSHSVQMTR